MRLLAFLSFQQIMTPVEDPVSPAERRKFFSLLLELGIRRRGLRINIYKRVANILRKSIRNQQIMFVFESFQLVKILGIGQKYVVRVALTQRIKLPTFIFGDLRQLFDLAKHLEPGKSRQSCKFEIQLLIFDPDIFEFYSSVVELDRYLR